MNLTGSVLPGYQVYEYLLVLSPHQELCKRITDVREEFGQKFRLESSTKGRPRVSLVNFIQYAMMEERIINRLQNVAMSYYPFKIELKDFGSFPAHTIYINVTSKVPVQGLVKRVRTGAQRLMKLNDDNKPHFILEPHLTIARKLKPWQYEKGWLEYSSKSFKGRFIADAMQLLKRPVGEMKYQMVKRFEFQNLPVLTRQGELFG
jgi:2'-5' RNA ligase